MSAPLQEYAIPGSYSPDRLRRALPKGSPRRLAVADRDPDTIAYPPEIY